MTKSLAGKVALVTGGSRGLGAATATALADAGAHVALTYVAAEHHARDLPARLTAKGVKAIAIRADQGDPATATALVQTVVQRLGALDILVNNAAIAVQGKAIDDPEIDNEAMDRQWAVNLHGVIANIRAAVNVLPERGRIISVGSGLGTRVGFAGTTDYAATKAAVIGYSRGAARDLGPRGITVNVVQAGLMDTGMAADSEGNLPATVMDAHAIKRFAAVEEVAAAIVFLAGSDADFITGSVLNVDGGFNA
jgi:NAD(P)-dependent dehydrogenase (short-subunit alcohol dehydrogenase family)